VTRIGTYLAILAGAGTIGCAVADLPAAARGSETVQVRKGDPPDGYIEVGAISATNGNGCGGFGARGTHEGAMAELKNQAVRMKADYVRLDIAVEPHDVPGGCFDNDYVLRGVAFRRGAAPVSSASASPPPREGGLAGGELALAGRSDEERLRAIGNFVGQKVVLHLKSGEVLAATAVGVTPPDVVKVVLFDQTARSLHAGEIERLRPSP